MTIVLAFPLPDPFFLESSMSELPIQPPGKIPPPETERPPSGKLRRLGIYGARDTGKTCYLACLYGARTEDNAAVTFATDASLDHLKACWKTLQRSEVPSATALGIPSELDLHLQAEGLAWEIPTRDYAGSLVQRSETGVPELKQEVKEWLASCHAILLFINTDAAEEAVRDRLDELNLLVAELKRHSRDGNTIGRPLALLLTKWDRQGEISADPETERRRALEYLNSRPALKQIGETLRNCGDRVELFPLSAFGSSRDGNNPPIGGPRPIGLLAPLVWAVQKADELLLARARREAVECAGSHRFWWQRHYRRAVAYYRKLQTEHGIDKGPIHDKARQELENWQNLLWKRCAWVSLSALAVLMGVVLIGLSIHEHGLGNRALAALTDPAIPPTEVEQIGDDYLTSWNPLTHWGGRRDDIVERLENVKNERERQAFAVLDTYRTDHPEEEAADSCAKQCQEFLKSYSNSSHVAMVKIWGTEDQTRAQSYRDHLDFDKEHPQLLATLADLGNGNYDEKIAACQRFLSQFPKTRFPKRTAPRQEIEEKLDEFMNALGEDAWQDVVKFATQTPNAFDKIIERATTYANRPDARYRKEAQNLIALKETQWDQSEYETVRKAVVEVDDSSSALAAERISRHYINGAHPRKRGEKDVKRWLAWFEGLQTERDYEIEVEQIEIPRSSALAERVVDEECRVHITLNGTKHTTAWHRGRNPQIGETLGPFPLKWGQESTLQVEIEEYDRFDPNDWAKGETTDQRFVLFQANQSFSVTCENNQEIPVFLKCPAIEPPRLGPYPDK